MSKEHTSHESDFSSTPEAYVWTCAAPSSAGAPAAPRRAAPAPLEQGRTNRLLVYLIDELSIVSHPPLAACSSSIVTGCQLSSLTSCDYESVMCVSRIMHLNNWNL